MKDVRTRYKSSTLGLPGLAFIYLILSLLALLFSAQLFTRAVRGTLAAMPLLLAVFLVIPAVLTIFLGISLFRLAAEVFSGRPGSRFKARMLIYFILCAALASAPATIINTRFILELVRAWQGSQTLSALEETQSFALDSYKYRLATLAWLGKSPEFAAAPLRDAAELRALDEAVLAVQEFRHTGSSGWKESGFAGDDAYRSAVPPAATQGFLPRSAAGSAETIRYAAVLGPGRVRIITFDLGGDLSGRLGLVEASLERLRAIKALEERLGLLLIIFYSAFSLPTLLMTMIIAVTLSGMITQPIVDLAEATRKVAEGDFSIRILSRRGDELGALVASFNAMVQDLERSRSAAMRAEKITLWQDMAQRLAHEVKNPLTPIKLSAERVLRRFRTDPEGVRDILEQSMLAIIQEVDGLSSLLSEFRAFSRANEPTLARTELRALVEETIALYRNSYPAVEFRLEGLGRDIYLKADRRHLAQVLANLVLNAVDAMDGEGVVEFGSDLVKKRDSRYCRLNIRDSGKGIPEDARSQVFTPYFTTKAGGTGLGLPIVERIVVDHGGAIWFDSAVGVGTTFFIDLPIDSAPAGGVLEGGET